jgi:uncharacterized protein YbjQ (UPF0145 family)
MLNRDDLLAFTRPELAKDQILMTGAEGFDGYEIVAYQGMVWGISVRAKDMGQDCAMGCKMLTGGELESYTHLSDESRQRAVNRMLQMAGRLGANGITNVDFELSYGGTSQGGGGASVIVHGTAVVIRPIRGYVPTGAVGNILAEISDTLSEKK